MQAGGAVASARAWTRSPWLVPALFVFVQVVVQFFHRAPIGLTVENDFPVHAAHAATWRDVFTFHGLYPLGHALVLRLFSLLTGDPFLAAKAIAILAAGLSLRVAHGLVRDVASAGAAFAGQTYLALNWYFHETALLVGTDQLASLLALLAIRSLASSLRSADRRRALAGGLWAGAAALVRQTSLVLLPAYLLAAAWQGRRDRRRRRGAWLAALCLAGCLVAAAPQMWIAWRATGDPFHQSQARNVRFGMQGDMDWSGFAAGDEPSLVEIVRREPGPFFTHWARETLQGGVRIAAMTASVFPPFLGRRIGGAVPLIYLGLTGAALLATLAALRAQRLRELAARVTPPDGAAMFLILLVVGWIAGVGLAFATARFLLTPWILCALAAVAVWRDLWRPEPGTGDRRATIARYTWIVVLACHTAGAIYFTLRLPA